MTGCATILELNNTTDPSPRPIETGRDGNYRLPVCCCRDNHSLEKNDYNRPFKHVCHARWQTLSSTTDPNTVALPQPGILRKIKLVSEGYEST